MTEKWFPRDESIAEVNAFAEENFGSYQVMIDSEDKTLNIKVYTGDNDSKYNYDDLLDYDYDSFKLVTLHELWADHDTQIIELKEI